MCVLSGIGIAGLGVVHRGEWVMPAETVNHYGLSGMAAIQSGRASAAPGATARGDMKVIVVADIRAAALEAMRSDPGTQHIIQTIDGRRLDLGFNT